MNGCLSWLPSPRCISIYVEGVTETLKMALEIVNRHDITYEHCEGEAQHNNPDQRFRDRYFGEDATFYRKSER